MNFLTPSTITAVVIIIKLTKKETARTVAHLIKFVSFESIELKVEFSSGSGCSSVELNQKNNAINAIQWLVKSTSHTKTSRNSMLGNNTNVLISRVQMCVNKIYFKTRVMRVSIWNSLVTDKNQIIFFRITSWSNIQMKVKYDGEATK